MLPIGSGTQEFVGWLLLVKIHLNELLIESIILNWIINELHVAVSD